MPRFKYVSRYWYYYFSCISSFRGMQSSKAMRYSVMVTV